MPADRPAPARSAPDLEALRAAVARIESGEAEPRPGPRGGTRRRKRTVAERPPATQVPTAESMQPAQREDQGRRGAPDRPADPRDADADADPYAIARAIVLRQLTMAPRSRHQLRERLRQRDCPDEVAEAVLDRMTEVGLVDDEKYAEALVRSKQVTTGLSKRGLAHELRAKGVDREIADSVLDQVKEADEEDRARDLVGARLGRLRGLDREVAMRRLAGMLARKGYPAGLSLRVIREAIDDDPAFRRD